MEFYIRDFFIVINYFKNLLLKNVSDEKSNRDQNP